MDKSFIFFCIEEIAIVALFVLLAIHFEHWWIALFSLLFMGSFHSSSDESDKKKEQNQDSEKGE